MPPEPDGAAPAEPDGAAPAEPDGAAPPNECSRDSDCTAVENPDPRHCTVACVWRGSRASCELQGKDDDADGDLDAACVSGGGGDCDDGKASVYRGAAEQCDGLDNDCNLSSDLDDGLPIGGEPRLLREMTGTGSLGVAAAPEGYGVLVMQRDRLSDVLSKQVEIVIVSRDGSSRSLTVTGDFGAEPAIGYYDDFFTLFDRSPSQSMARFVRFPFPEALVLRSPIARPDSITLSFSTPTEQFPETSAALFAGVYEPNVGSTSCSIGLSNTGTRNCTRLLVVPEPSIVLSAAMTSDLVAWVQASGSINSSHELSVLYATHDPEIGALRPATLLHERHTANDGTPNRFYTFMTIRPQVAAWKDNMAVGWLEPSGLRVARIAPDGTEICRTPAASPIAFWGMTNSLLMFARPGAKAPDTYAVGATADGTPVMAQLSGCAWGHVLPLSTPGAKVALGPNTGQGMANLEVGHPVIASYFDGQIGVSWMEPPNTDGLHRLMFRSFGPEVCK